MYAIMKEMKELKEKASSETSQPRKRKRLVQERSSQIG
jgi:hypothetical protein